MNPTAVKNPDGRTHCISCPLASPNASKARTPRLDSASLTTDCSRTRPSPAFVYSGRIRAVIRRIASGLTVLVAQAADFFDLGLSTLFLPEDPQVRVLLNYGTAALIWYVITVVVVRLVRRLG